MTHDLPTAAPRTRSVGARNVFLLFWPIMLLLFFALFSRIESEEQLWLLRIADVVLGLIVAVSFALAREGNFRPRFITLALALVVWSVASGSLVAWHGFTWYARNTAAWVAWTRHAIVQTYSALTAYSKDCGSFPSGALGLSALGTNPGVAGWRGPYMPEGQMRTDAWRRPLQYLLRDGKPVVWSWGADGTAGTEDDIVVGYVETCDTLQGKKVSRALEGP